MCDFPHVSLRGICSRTRSVGGRGGFGCACGTWFACHAPAMFVEGYLVQVGLRKPNGTPPFRGFFHVDISTPTQLALVTSEHPGELPFVWSE